MAEHTPGPWVTVVFGNKEDDGGKFAICPAGRAGDIACIEFFDYDCVTAYANARLITAAPNMLEALRAMDEFAWSAVRADCQESHEGLSERIAKVRAAIARAVR